MSDAPWWLPSEWQTLVLALLAGICIVQVWKGWMRFRYQKKPRNWCTRAFAISVTGLIIFVLSLLDGESIQASLRLALLWGLPQPFLYAGLQSLLRRHAPYVAWAINEQRREMHPRKPPDAWTDDERRYYRARAQSIINGPNSKNERRKRDRKAAGTAP